MHGAATAAVLAPTGGGQVVAAGAPEPAPGHAHLPGAPDHDHGDPATKNAVSRAAVAPGEAIDPTSAAERAGRRRMSSASAPCPIPS